MRERFETVTRFLRLAALAAGGLAVAACAAPPPQQAQIRATPAPAREIPRDNAFDPNAPTVVALLAPQGASNERARAEAQGIVQAARLAQRDLADPYLDLRVYDTGETPEAATAAAARALQDGARLILGPLFAESARALAPVAGAQGVNVISFSTTADAAGGNVWLIGMLPEPEAERIVGFASSQGYGALGVFRADNAYGDAASAAIYNAALGSGASVRAETAYQRSFEGIQAAAEGYAAEHLASGATAVVLPSEGQELQTAASFLNFHDLFPSRVKYLGLSGWAKPATMKEASLRGGWFAAPDPRRLAEFSARFQEAYGSAPSALASLGYDAVAAAGAMLSEARRSNVRTGFDAAAITDPAGFWGVNGVFRFTPDGLNQRGLAVLEVQPNEFVVVDPAPQSFGAGF